MDLKVKNKFKIIMKNKKLRRNYKKLKKENKNLLKKKKFLQLHLNQRNNSLQCILKVKKRIEKKIIFYYKKFKNFKNYFFLIF